MDARKEPVTQVAFVPGSMPGLALIENIKLLIMEMFGNTLCITHAELVGTGIMSKSNFDKYAREHKFRVLQKGGNGRKVLVIYESLPDKLRTIVEETLPYAKEKLKPQLPPMDERLKSDIRAIDFYKTYTPKIEAERQAEYVLNVKVLNAMMAQEASMTSMHNANGHTHKKLVRDTIVELCEKLRQRYGHTLPKSEPRLLEKYAAYKKESYQVLINNNIGNQSTRKINAKEGRLLLKLKRSKFPVYTDMQIFDEYNRLALDKGLKPIKSPRTVTNYLYQTAIKLWWYAEVYGEIAFKNEFMPSFDTQLPEMPNTLWYGDGTKLNLYYKDYDSKNKRMVARTIDVYEVMDACTEMFLGYSFGAENFATQYDAYRMALETWKVKPNEIVTDNQGGHKKPEAKAFFQKICHLHKTTMPHNGQSKSIESAFGRFQAQVLHRLYNYTGQNITATKQSSHVNVELITTNIAQLPTLEEVKQQYLQCREEWSHMEHPTSETGMTRLEMYTTLSSPNAEPLDDYEVQELFKLFSKSSVQYSQQGFIFDINKREYRYMVYNDEGHVDLNFHMQHVGVSFHYRYDPQDMNAIELWEVDSAGGLKYATIATPKVKVHRATADRTPEDNDYLFGQLHDNRCALVGHYIAREELMLDDCQGEAYIALKMPRPVGVSAKDMDAYREAYEEETLTAPVAYPDGMGPGTYEPDSDDDDELLGVGITSVGEYTKQTSGITDIDYLEGYLS